MANLQHHTRLISQAHNLAPLLFADSNGFLQQHMHALLKKRARHSQMGRGRNHNAHGINAAKQVMAIGNSLTAAFASHLFRCF